MDPLVDEPQNIQPPCENGMNIRANNGDLQQLLHVYKSQSLFLKKEIELLETMQLQLVKVLT